MTTRYVYNLGTVTVAAGQTAVTGALTAWTQYVREGDLIVINGHVGSIASDPVSGTSLTLATPWTGPTVEGASYAIMLFSPRHTWEPDVWAEIRSALKATNFILTGADAPTSPIGVKGDLYFRVNTAGATIAFYMRGDTAWSAPISLVGVGTPTPVSGDAGKAVFVNASSNGYELRPENTPFGNEAIAVSAQTAVGSADKGKMFKLNLSIRQVLPLPDPATLPRGWFIDVEVMGNPTGYQTAYLQHGGAASIKFRHDSFLSDRFHFIGGGEVFRIIWDGISILSAICLRNPATLQLYRGVTPSGSGYGDCTPAWANIPFNAWLWGGAGHLLDVVGGNIKLPVSGQWSIRLRVTFYNPDGVVREAGAEVGSGSPEYAYENIPSGGHLVPPMPMLNNRLPAGFSVQANIFGTGNMKWQHGGTYLLIHLLSR